MTNKLPPTPPANRSDKGTGEAKAAPDELGHIQDQTTNPDKIGQTGAVAQNTHHQGHQQDR